jgi:hypothetical protein
MAHSVHPPLEPLLAEALDAIRRIIRVLRLSSSQTQREFGVTGAQLFVLQQLIEGSLGVGGGAVPGGARAGGAPALLQ